MYYDKMNFHLFSIANKLKTMKKYWFQFWNQNKIHTSSSICDCVVMEKWLYRRRKKCTYFYVASFFMYHVYLSIYMYLYTYYYIYKKSSSRYILALSHCTILSNFVLTTNKFFYSIPCLTQFCLNADFALLWFLVENLLCKIFPMPEFLQNPKLM